MTTLDEAMADRFARIALGHVEREYPNHILHALEGPDDARTPRELHPVFCGSYDWHSCVHGYWMLARLLRLFPQMDAAPAIRVLFERALVPEKVAGECDYFDRPLARGYERPYGWGWLLKLAAELHAHEEDRWRQALQPLTDRITRRFMDFLPLATYPVRVGTHYNTAFALRLAADYAETADDQALLRLLTETAQRWYGTDEDCPAWGEPSGDDFLSPTLIEAECMRRLMQPSAFSDWFPRFLPKLDQGQPACLFAPARVSDRSDGKIAHLDGLNLSRAWCLSVLATTHPENSPTKASLEAAASQHLAAGLKHVAGDYMGEHWLASFAVLAMTEPR
ncbi:DUF2891 domain-containing protein [Peteryoungia desertarenae]|uniref:DUF2891 domain-containing protein n=1 Tax=Peteryoungia desertarenae TaxID=1813451 RepID=A0ABX6QP60_9HYPH|nr:DUF2891 domain-containing protein [Peteryoungia desertarenae]QLF70035.1 DUF2891 domain-containing protein [Peteryoungia desertarenae]